MAEPTDETSQSADAGQAAGGEQDSLRAERDRYYEMALRARADLDNYQKRVARDLDAERRFSALPLIRDLLPAIDNLERAIESATESGDCPGIVDGIQMVRGMLLEALGKHGVETIDPIDQMFDPNLHEAVSQHASPDVPPMTVLMTLRKGYKLHERVIRPAQVLVSSAP